MTNDERMTKHETRMGKAWSGLRAWVFGLLSSFVVA
jgi:hypothetical protein